MSTRLYPLYQKGSPQLRIFLPNFWLKLVKPTEEQPPNVVQFMCSHQMTKYDIKNYLEKIYDIKTINIRTRIAMGKTFRDPARGYIKKEDDIKYAYVTLPREEKFEFPNLFPDEEDKKIKEEEQKSLEESKATYKKFLEKNKERGSTPGWFSI